MTAGKVAAGADTRPLRRDAARNIEKITEAAMEAFADRGLDVSMADVAERAGVGVGTVYRRFGDKDGLIEALFVDRLEEVFSLAQRALADHPPERAFMEFVLTCSEALTANKGLRQLLLEGALKPPASGLGLLERLAPIIATLINNARESGGLRDTLAATDFPVMMIAIGAVRDFGGAENPDIWRRILYLLINGMCSESTTPTEVAFPAALSELDFKIAMERKHA